MIDSTFEKNQPCMCLLLLVYSKCIKISSMVRTLINKFEKFALNFQNIEAGICFWKSQYFEVELFLLIVSSSEALTFI